MSKHDKIDFISGSKGKEKEELRRPLVKCTTRHLNRIIRMIGQRIIQQSEEEVTALLAA